MDNSTTKIFEQEIIGLDEVKKESSSSEVIPCLTIIYHPDIKRIGERYKCLEFLSGSINRIPVNRFFPLFKKVAAESDYHLSSTPLGETYISRSMLEICKISDGYEIKLKRTTDRILVNSCPCKTKCHISSEMLENGVVINLRNKIVLLFHLLPLDLPFVTGDYGFVGESGNSAIVKSLISKVSDLDVSVLICGESGTGKELIAESIHRLSKRSKESLVSLNMGSIPESLAESELFGYKKGAFSGALKDRRGYFEQAHKGTLFLDEIGDTPENIQISILRALELKVIRPIGSEQEIKTDVRVISATDADLEEKIAKNQFKNSLLQRLSRFVIHVEPLRQRKDDISRLILHFIKSQDIDHGLYDSLLKNGNADEIFKMFTFLSCQNWRGNVRHLENVISQLVVLNRGENSFAFIKYIPLLQRNGGFESDADFIQILGAKQYNLFESESSKKLSVDGFSSSEARQISSDKLEEKMHELLFNISLVAKSFGTSRQNIYNLVEKHPNLNLAKDIKAGDVEQAFRFCQGDLTCMVKKLKISESSVRRKLNELLLEH